MITIVNGKEYNKISLTEERHFAINSWDVIKDDHRCFGCHFMNSDYSCDMSDKEYIRLLRNKTTCTLNRNTLSIFKEIESTNNS